MARNEFALSDLVADLPRIYVGDEIKIQRSYGSWAFVTDDAVLMNQVRNYFVAPGDRELLAKIWQYPVHSHRISDLQWGRFFNLQYEPGLDVSKRGRLLDSLKVQNFFAARGVAPSIYGMFVIVTPMGSEHIAVLMENANSMAPVGACNVDEIAKSILAVCAKYGIEAPWIDMATKNHFINGMMVDWQHSLLGSEYVKNLSRFYLERTQFGESKYQSAPAIGVFEGIRNSAKRIRDLRLDHIDLRGKTVVDIGCNGGQFLNYSASRGARFGLGVDWPAVVEGARAVSNYLGHFNIEYRGAALHNSISRDWFPLRRFDIGYFLSMVTHVGVPEYLDNLADLLVVEVNHQNQVAEAIGRLSSNFWVVATGKASDHGDRSLFMCFRKDCYDEAAARGYFNGSGTALG